jgi:hypothetical protein
MADDYRKFSTWIRNVTAEERAWIDRVLRMNQGGDAHRVASNLGLDPNDLPDESFPDFLWEFEDHAGAAYLSLYAEHFVDVEHVAWFAQHFLQRFRPQDWFGMEYADTCSQPRIGCFQGGAVFVTATDMQFHHTGGWLSRQVGKFASEQGAAGPIDTYDERFPY